MGEMGFAQPLKRLVKGDNNREEKNFGITAGGYCNCQRRFSCAARTFGGKQP